MITVASEKIKWHPAFAAAIQLEFKEYQEYLNFEEEHQLTEEPLKIDVVIIKKLQDVYINKSIGKILAKYNIFEYKSPTDYLSIDDYYKVKAYAYLYKALSKNTNSIDIDEITITLTSTKKPKKLIKYLKEKSIDVVCEGKGLYYIENTDIKIQLLVMRELPDEEGEYLKLLQLEHKNINLLNKWMNEYIKNNKNPLYEIIMSVIAQSNPNNLMEVYKEMAKVQLNESNQIFLKDMVKKFDLDKEFKEEGKIEGKIEGKAEAIVEILNDKGFVPEDFKKKIYSQKDADILKIWLKFAVKCDSIDEFKNLSNM